VLRAVVASSMRYRYVVLALAVALMAIGGLQLRGAPVDVFPEFAPPRVEVQTAGLGLTAEEVEQLVTVPLEEVLNGVAGLDVMRSNSVAQLSSIVLLFRPGTDLLTARQLVQERVASVTPTLPAWVTPPAIMQPLSATSRTMKIGLSSSDLSLIELSTLARYKIRPRLMGVPGVANVAIWGYRNQQLQLLLDPAKMAAAGVSLDRVEQVTADALDSGLLQHANGSVVGTGGRIETPNQQLGVRHVLPIVSPRTLAEVTVDERPGGPLRLADLGSVVEGHQLLVGDAVINDGPGLMLVVEKLPWGNSLDVTRGVEQAMRALQPGLPGVEVDTHIFRPATFIGEAIDNLSTALLLGCLLVVLVLGAFLFAWRTALISLVAIPLSLVAAGLVLHLRGATLNTMVLAGLVIAVGVVVDDAIIDIENIVRRLREHRRTASERPVAAVILDASLEVRGPIVYATLIIVAAALPVFFLTGLTGAFFRPLALSYTLAVLASLVVALTVTPAMALLLLRGSSLDRGEPPLVRVLKRAYGAVLRRVVRRPGAAAGAMLALLLAGLAILPQLGQSLLPSFKERDLLMHWVTTPGTSHPEMLRITEQASRELRAVPGVRNFGAHIGQAQEADEVVGVNFGENWISIDPGADYDATVARVQDVVDGYPGLFRDVQTYLKERIREVLTGASETIVVRVYGPDLATLRATAQEIEGALGEVEGVVEEGVELQDDIPQVTVEVDLAAAQRHGVKPGDVRRATATMVAGLEVGDLYRGGKAYDVRVWGQPDIRRDPGSIRRLPLDTASGGQVALGEVATVSLTPTPSSIRREAGSRRVDVGANVRGRDLGAVAEEVERRLQQVRLPQGYHAEVIGEYAEREAAQTRLLLSAGLALLAVLMLLRTSFDSWRLAVLVLATLPTALVGGVLATWLIGGTVSLGSLVGFFTVMGIAARNGILLITHFRHLERDEGEVFGAALVGRGAGERLSPILMTTLATGLALVPLVAIGNVPGHEIEHPMAVVILGGLVTSTLVNLLVVPPLYLRLARPRPMPPPDRRARHRAFRSVGR
jgi:CzcA family heavy metal efflux pump